MVRLPIESLGRAAYETFVARNASRVPWSALSDPVKVHWYDVARAVMTKAAERL